MSQAAPQTHAHVEVDLNYLLNTGERPVNYAITPPEGVPQRSGVVAPTRVRVHNARLEAEPPTLDRNGFQLVQHSSQVDFANEPAIRELY